MEFKVLIENHPAKLKFLEWMVAVNFAIINLISSLHLIELAIN